MSLRLRRSVRSKTESKFNVGDIVEYKRRSKTGQGRLSFRLTEGDSPNPLWLVTFDRASAKDEEIYEKHFTRLVEKSKGPKVDGRKTKGKRGGARRRSSSSDEEAGNEGEDAAPPQDAAEGKSGSNSSSDDKSSSGAGRRSKKDKKLRLAEDAAAAESKDEDDEDDGAASDSSAPSTKKGKGGVDRGDRAASRAARSQRRQAKIEVTVTEEVSKKTSGAKRPADAAAADDENGKKAKPADDEVVKVKMNTGTLYLYKGLHRRAVFVRKF
mmetsp:Transcript_28465/g.66820  ORF Transcript_28465/g.66820 Transcript_28465/m.66820 type:complete len:269 (-) Transcript_28465:123-929(-)